MKLKGKTLALVLFSTISLFTKAQPLPANVPTNGLVGWWPFNGNAKDESGNANHGTVNGATLTTDRNGSTNKAYSFDGSSNDISISTNSKLQPTNAISLSAWIKLTATQLYFSTVLQLRYENYNDPYVSYSIGSQNQIFRGGISNGVTGSLTNCATNTSYSINQWIMVTLTYDGSTMRWYENGVLINSVSKSGTIGYSNLHPIRIGDDGLGDYFTGNIDDVGIWNRALTESEIKLLYNPASFLVQPKNAVTKLGANAMFVVKTVDSGATYQWQTNTGSGFTNISNGGQYTGASNDTLFVSNIQQANNNQLFRCIAKTGNDSDYSFAVSIIISNVPNNIPLNGLVAYWLLNGNGVDGSGNGNNLTSKGNNIYTTDRFGNTNSCASFNGMGTGYFERINSRLPKGNSARTVSFWYKTADSSRNQIAFCLWGGYDFCHSNFAAIANTKGVYFWGKCEDKYFGFKNSSDWTQIVMVYENNFMKLYRNGTLINNINDSNYKFKANLRTDNYHFTIGMNPTSDFPVNFDGLIDDFGFWDRPLSDDEIRKLYNPAKIIVQPKNIVTKAATNGNFYIQTVDSGITYQWQTNTGSGFTNISNGGQFAGANNDTLVVKNIQLANNNDQFRCITKAGKDRDTSETANIYVINVPAYMSDSGLVGWWPFNGNTNDESGNGNNGVNNGAKLSTDRFGISNNAYSFDGAGSFINVPNSSSLQFNGGLTVSAWLNASSAPYPVSYWFSKGADGGTPYSWVSNLSSPSNKMSVTIFSYNNQNCGANSSTALMLNKWVHAVATFDGTFAKFYVNGKLESSTACTFTTFSNIYDLRFGRRYVSGDPYYWNGKLDDFGIWNRALTQQEIIDLYQPCHATILMQPVNAITKIDENVRFIVKSLDTNVIYQWQQNSGNGFVNLSNGAQYSGVDKDTLRISKVTQSMNQFRFRCIAVSSSCSDTSNAALLGIRNVPAYVPSTGLVAWWPFSGNALDSSGYGNHGQVKGATLTTDRNGNPNSAYEFNGSNNYINIANSELKKAINNVSQVTIVTWVNLPDLSLWGGGIFNHWQKGPLSNNVGLQFGYYGNKTMGVSSLNGIGVPTTPAQLTQNEWAMLTCVYDGTQTDPKDRFKVYIGNNINVPLNCSNPGNCDFPNTTSADANETYIGALTDGGSDAWMYFKGKIDDMGVWNRILSQEEITMLLNDCKPSIVQQPSNQTVKESEKAIFTVTSSEPNASYTWQGNNGFGFVNLFNAGSFSGVNDDTLTITNSSLLNNNLQLRCIVNSGKCTDTTTTVVLNVLKANKISQYKASDLLQLYPNPAHGSFHLRVHPSLIGQSFIISDIQGRELFSGTIENDHVLITPKLQDAGVYILQTSGGFHYKFQYLNN